MTRAAMTTTPGTVTGIENGFTFYVDATTGNRKFNGMTTLGVVGFDNGREVMRDFRQLSVGLNIFDSEMTAVAELLGRLLKMRDQIFGKRARQINKAAYRTAARRGGNSINQASSAASLVIGVPITVYGDNAAVVQFISRVQEMEDNEFSRIYGYPSERNELLQRLRGLLSVFPKMKMRFVRGADNIADAPSRNIGVNH